VKSIFNPTFLQDGGTLLKVKLMYMYPLEVRALLVSVTVSPVVPFAGYLPELPGENGK
jgi:hypothetical protein